MMSTTEGELDVEVPHGREEGELEDSDVEEGTYIPLARPEAFNPPSLVHMQIQDEQSDEASAQESSGSESDDEPRRRAKRTKLRPRRPHQQPDKKNKYNIWCKALQEDLLTEDMVSCDVSKKSRYGIESYDYTIKYRLDDNYISKKVFTNNEDYNDSERLSNKRRNVDRSNVKLRLGKRVNCHNRNDKLKPRLLRDLIVNADDPVEIVANDIAEKLSEDKKELIGRIVEVLGASKAIEIFIETQRVEAEGGMLVMNGTRRRTSGGIYFFLVKRDGDVSQEMANQIFTKEVTAQRKVKRARSKNRQKVMEQLKQSLTDSELPSLLSRGEAVTQSEHGSNPPPSPATDARECSSDTDAPASPQRPQRPLPDRTDAAGAADPTDPTVAADPRRLQDYEDDDFLEVMCNDDMDLF